VQSIVKGTIKRLQSEVQYNMYVNCKLGWHPVAVVQYTFTHKQYIEQHNETQYLEQNIANSKNT